MEKKLKKAINLKAWNHIADILFPVLLILFSLMHIGEGIDVTDTGYNYGNYMFFDTLDDMWKFSTYLSGALGAFFTYLPFGKTLMGLNFYTGLIKVAAALLSYYCGIKVFKMKKEAVFLGEMVALGLCWCPTSLIYNYLTYLLFTVGAICLYLGITQEKKKFYVIAGVALSLNVFVRLPNVAEIALIFTLWMAGFFYKKKIGQVVKETLWCVLGYVIGLGTVFGYICIRYGLKRYVDGIKALFAMTEEADGYTTTQMILASINDYRLYLPWLIKMALLVLGGMVLYKILEKKWVLVKGIFFTLCALAAFLFFQRRGFFNFNYRGYPSFFGPAAVFLMICLLLFAYIVFFSKREKEEKVFAVIGAVIILITPLGSNNHLYSPINNLFLVAPFVANDIFNLLSGSKSSIMIGKVSFSTVPYKITLVIFCGIVFWQSLCFGSSFVFRDGLDGEKRDTFVENNPVLSYMRTPKENAEGLQELNDYLVENDFIGESVLLFGDVPALSFYFQLDPAISSTWPDLESYSQTKFAQEIDRLEAEKKTPIILITPEVLEMGANENTAKPYKNKVERLTKFIEDNHYEMTFMNDRFLVYTVGSGR